MIIDSVHNIYCIKKSYMFPMVWKCSSFFAPVSPILICCSRSYDSEERVSEGVSP